MKGVSQAGRVQTVLGPINPGDLGPTMTHEHILGSFDGVFPVPEEASYRGRYEAPFSLGILGWIHHGRWPNSDNAKLDDISTLIEEVELYKQFGGSALVDATNIGIGRDPVGLARISRGTGVHIIMGSSFYVASRHPADMDERTEDSLTGQMVRDVRNGVGITGVRSGVLGEVGCSFPLHPNERKVLRATARAQRETGAPILIHPGRDQSCPAEIMEILKEAGADLTRVIVGHLDRTLFDRRLIKELAETGCFLEYDVFGQEVSYYPPAPHIDIMNDAQRLNVIEWLISEGHGGQIVVGHDIAQKAHLVKYGGHGYGYFLEYMVPRMRIKGFREDDIQRILVENPKRALTFAEPG